MTTIEELNEKLNKEIEVAKKRGLPGFVICGVKRAMEETKKQLSVLERVQRDCKRHTSSGSCKRCPFYSVAPEVESRGKEKGFCRFGMKPTEWRL